MKKKQKIGFFGGTFDPIHNGHLHLALWMLEHHSLDQIWFCPNSQSPHKTSHPPFASKEHRRAMTAAAISPIPAFTFIDLEIQRATPSYTIDTIKACIEIPSEIERHYFLIFANDALPTIQLWKEYETLIKLAPPLIGLRDGKETKLSKDIAKPTRALIQEGITSMPILEISSTNIRERIAQGLFCGHLVPEKVYEYIAQHNLYR